MASIEVKIKKLDGELARYKEQMSRLRNGPGKVRLPLPAARPCDGGNQHISLWLGTDTPVFPSPFLPDRLAV